MRYRGGRIACLVCAAALALSGCGPTRLTVKADIPPLLVTPMPLAMGVRIPKSFSGYVQKESAQERRWEIQLGAGQADAIRRVTSAMFARTLMLGEQAPGDAAAIAEQKLNGIVEVTLDSYVYLLPSAGGSDYYSATIGYKVNLLSPAGGLLGSWIYEGYGSAPSRGLGNAKGVELVSGLAIRDACANLAVHLPEQELLRNLLAPATSAPGVPSATPARPEASTPAAAAPGSEAKTAAPVAPDTPAPNKATAPSVPAARPGPTLPPTPDTTPAPQTSPTPSAAEAPPSRGQ